MTTPRGALTVDHLVHHLNVVGIVVDRGPWPGPRSFRRRDRALTVGAARRLLRRKDHEGGLPRKAASNELASLCRLDRLFFGYPYLESHLERRFVTWDELAAAARVSVIHVDNVNGEKAVMALEDWAADVAVIAGCRILQPDILSIPRLGFVTKHSSLPPRQFGAALGADDQGRDPARSGLFGPREDDAAAPVVQQVAHAAHAYGHGFQHGVRQALRAVGQQQGVRHLAERVRSVLPAVKSHPPPNAQTPGEGIEFAAPRPVAHQRKFDMRMVRHQDRERAHGTVHAFLDTETTRDAEDEPIRRHAQDLPRRLGGLAPLEFLRVDASSNARMGRRGPDNEQTGGD